MNSVLSSQPVVAPHLLPQNRLSPTRSAPSNFPNMNNRKRKADDDASGESDERMSASPSNSPSMGSRPFAAGPSHRVTKRMRSNTVGRPLTLPRLLETLNADEMRTLLSSICERNPQIGAEVVSTAPRPSVGSALGVLGQYETALQTSFPFGGRNSDYSYNRVRLPLSNLLDALKDYTPHFLPPNEAQATTSMTFLDGATEVIHRLPDWDNFQHNRHKHEAYEEMAKAWALVIEEAAKRAGGIQLQYGGWDQKINKHNEMSGGRMQDAVNALRSSLGWMGGEMNAGFPTTPNTINDPNSIRQQLLSGTYGPSTQVQVGPW